MPYATRECRIMGVAVELGLDKDVRSDLDLADAIRSGLSHRALEHVLETGRLSPTEVYELVGSRRTLLRKRRAGKPLSAGESDRLARIVRVVVRAEEALGDRDKAHRWLRKENRALDGRRPLDLLASDVGTRAVEQVLGRIEHGVYS
jgi:putative toxin-antitoxin system antitoxin component (TIGR02293 family)